MDAGSGDTGVCSGGSYHFTPIQGFLKDTDKAQTWMSVQVEARGMPLQIGKGLSELLRWNMANVALTGGTFCFSARTQDDCFRWKASQVLAARLPASDVARRPLLPLLGRLQSSLFSWDRSQKQVLERSYGHVGVGFVAAQQKRRNQ